MLYRVDF